MHRTPRCRSGFRLSALGAASVICDSYSVAERYEVPLSDSLTLPVVRMIKNFKSNDRNA